MYDVKLIKTILSRYRMRPKKDSVHLPYKSLISMVCGRTNYSCHGVYKPTCNWGAPSCMWIGEVQESCPIVGGKGP